ncbi:hypothetical protein HanPI659440_Chr04g0159201 [Helianthus annuus]|nr:hypothetical protein HanPI659440_Chr04g0159201 [Helianthus annuus]
MTKTSAYINGPSHNSKEPFTDSHAGVQTREATSHIKADNVLCL